MRRSGEVDTGDAVLEAADGGMAALVKAHGVLTMERSATEATSVAMYPEEAAMTTHLAMLRGPVEELSREGIDRCHGWFRRNCGQGGRGKAGA